MSLKNEMRIGGVALGAALFSIVLFMLGELILAFASALLALILGIMARHTFRGRLAIYF